MKHMHRSHGVIGILLAAGGSSRLGRPKQLLSWDGQPLLVHSIAQLFAAGCDHILVVLGSAAEQCREACDKWIFAPTEERASLTWLENTQWNLGQSASLRLAVQALDTISEPSTPFLVALCDQPLMTGYNLRKLIEPVVEGHVRVAATRYEEGGGVPACFHRNCAKALLALDKDRGAKAWIRSQPAEQVALFDLGDATVDIDTQHDWEQLKFSLHRSSQWL